MSAPTTDLAGGATDLSRRVAVAGNEELPTISDSFNRFVTNVHDVLAQMKGGSDEVALASGEIWRGSTYLSARTDVQRETRGKG